MAERKQALKVVKKRWYPILASKSFDEALIGESLVASPADLVGRVVSVNLASLTGDIKQQHTSLKFKVASSEKDNACAELLGFEVTPAAIKRLIRRGSDRIDASVVCETGDGKKIRIKPFLLTKAYAGGSTLKQLRNSLVEFIVAEIKKLPSFEEAVKYMLQGTLQAGVKSALKKIYPIKACEIRNASLVTRGNPKAVAVAVAIDPTQKADEAAEATEAAEADEHSEAQLQGEEKKGMAGRAEEAEARQRQRHKAEA